MGMCPRGGARRDGGRLRPEALRARAGARAARGDRHTARWSCARSPSSSAIGSCAATSRCSTALRLPADDPERPDLLERRAVRRGRRAARRRPSRGRGRPRSPRRPRVSAHVTCSGTRTPVCCSPRRRARRRPGWWSSISSPTPTTSAERRRSSSPGERPASAPSCATPVSNKCDWSSVPAGIYAPGTGMTSGSGEPLRDGSAPVGLGNVPLRWWSCTTCGGVSVPVRLADESITGSYSARHARSATVPAARPAGAGSSRRPGPRRSGTTHGSATGWCGCRSSGSPWTRSSRSGCGGSTRRGSRCTEQRPTSRSPERRSPSATSRPRPPRTRTSDARARRRGGGAVTDRSPQPRGRHA